MTTSSLRRSLIFGDVHVPYHDKDAWRLLLKVGRAFRPHHLICLGDFGDFFGISTHSKDPRRQRLLVEEVAEMNARLDELDELGAAEKDFFGGNHEDRLQRYLCDKAPELFGLIDIPRLFDLRKRGWSYTAYKRDRRFGKLHVTHDVGTAGRYAVHKALDTYQHSVVTGHSHRLGYIVEGNAVGEHKVSASFGWLGDIEQADYMHHMQARKNWALGFGIGYHDTSTGFAYLTPIPIVRSSCVVEGRLFRV